MATRSPIGGLDSADPLNVYKAKQDLSPKERLDWFFDSFRRNPAYKGRWETEIMQNTTCVAADVDAGTIVYEVDIQPSFCTILGNLHGGAASTILDQLTSLVLHMYAKKQGIVQYGDVTRTLAVTCIRPVMAGAKVRLEAELVSLGKTMGNVKGVIKTMDGKICFACTHDKVILSTGVKI